MNEPLDKLLYRHAGELAVWKRGGSRTEHEELAKLHHEESVAWYKDLQEMMERQVDREYLSPSRFAAIKTPQHDEHTYIAESLAPIGVEMARRYGPDYVVKQFAELVKATIEATKTK